MKKLLVFSAVISLLLGFVVFLVFVYAEGECSDFKIGHGPTPKRDVCYYEQGFKKFNELFILHDSPTQEDDIIRALTETFNSCRSLAERRQDFVRCAGGAYHFLANRYWQEDVSLRVDYSVPFSICNRENDHSLAASCYSYMGRTLFSLPWNNFDELVSFAERYSQPKYIDRTVEGISLMYARHEFKKDEDVIAGCQKLSSPALEIHCYDGYAIGLVQIAPFFKKHREAFNFCANKKLSDSLKPGCFDTTFRELSKYWSRFFVEHACSLVPSDGAPFCKKGLEKFVERVWGEGGSH